MKKLSLAVTAVVIAILCTGASIWEGSAAVSIGGELPEGGYYAATKSFPRNTVVDITNLETGKSVRAIVAAGLDSPGLLAILSKDAAEIIGIQNRSIGRIRMTMPSDPIAFSRFTEGFNPNGDPDYDPRAAIAAASPRQAPQTPRQPLIPSEKAAAPGGTQPEWGVPEPAFPAAARAADTPSRAVRAVNDPIIPADTSSPAEKVLWPWEIPPASGPQNRPAETPPVPPQKPPAGPAAAPSLALKPEAVKPVETPKYPPSEPAYRPPAADRPDNAIAYERRPELSPKQTRENTARSAIVLEPAEARPPQPYTVLPLNSEITPIKPPPPAAANPPKTAQSGNTVQIPERDIIPGITEAAPVPRTKPEKPVQPPKVETVRNDTAGAAIEKPVLTQAAGTRFSAPLISALEKGMYYLQLRAYSKPDLVQAELSRLGSAYPLAVQAGGSQENPLYRILVGPVNLGESSALLQRFKGNGYKDAFVRQAE
jgi:hypothetical protein